jgi:rhodanese-related sulfurtransferase
MKKWCNWVKQVVTGGTVSVNINNKERPYFVSHKGVRQGDPLSPMLFNFAVDTLTRMIRKTQENGLITGLADNLIPRGVVMLQYADDTIICLEDGLENARNMKLLLYLYEVMSGLKINFSKSEVILINGDDDKNLQMAEIFNCQIGFFPIKYLGVPVSPSRLHVKDWTPVIEKNEKKLVVWKGGTMSIAGRTILINASLTNVVIYHMSMYLVPKTVADSLDKQRRVFF